MMTFLDRCVVAYKMAQYFQVLRVGHFLETDGLIVLESYPVSSDIIVSYFSSLKELSHGILSYFGHSHTKLPFNGRKLENNSLIR